MNIPSDTAIETNLRHCLLLKADDLYFTLSAPDGERVRNEFLGLEVEGLADENLSEEQIASINLDRFAIAERVTLLCTMLNERRLSLYDMGRPDADTGRQDALEFVEHFLSTLADIALGGLDLTSERNGAVREIYGLAYAWLNLIETIEEAFQGQTQSNLSVNDLALLSGLEVRTLRNRCGPDKQIRTSTERTSQERGRAAPALVNLHALDALDWLRSRKDFEISPIDRAWVSWKALNASPADATRGLLIASIVNLGALADFGPTVGLDPKEARRTFDEGEALSPEIIKSLSEQLGIAK